MRVRPAKLVKATESVAAAGAPARAACSPAPALRPAAAAATNSHMGCVLVRWSYKRLSLLLYL